jgi:hypothetical protein
MIIEIDRCKNDSENGTFSVLVSNDQSFGKFCKYGKIGFTSVFSNFHNGHASAEVVNFIKRVAMSYTTAVSEQRNTLGSGRV